MQKYNLGGKVGIGLLFYSRILMQSANNSNKSTYYSKDRTNNYYSFNIDQIVTNTRKIHFDSFPAIVLQDSM